MRKAAWRLSSLKVKEARTKRKVLKPIDRLSSSWRRGDTSRSPRLSSRFLKTTKTSTRRSNRSRNTQSKSTNGSVRLERSYVRVQIRILREHVKIWGSIFLEKRRSLSITTSSSKNFRRHSLIGSGPTCRTGVKIKRLSLTIRTKLAKSMSQSISASFTRQWEFFLILLSTSSNKR